MLSGIASAEDGTIPDGHRKASAETWTINNGNQKASAETWTINNGNQKASAPNDHCLTIVLTIDLTIV